MRIGSRTNQGRRSLRIRWALALPLALLLCGCQAASVDRPGMFRNVGTGSEPTKTPASASISAPEASRVVQASKVLPTLPATPPLVVEDAPPLPPGFAQNIAPKPIVAAISLDPQKPLTSLEAAPLDESTVKAEQLQALIVEEITPKKIVEVPLAASTKPEPSKPPIAPQIKRGEVELPPPARSDKLASPTPPATVPPVVKTPEQQWREGLEQLTSLARRNAAESRDGIDWKLRAKLLAWMGEPAIDTESNSLAQVESWRVLLRALQVVGRESKEPADAKTSTDGEELRAAQRALEDHAPLEMTDLALCRKVNGFGDYEPLEPAARKAGQTVVLYAELTGLTFEPAADAYRSRLASRVELLHESGEPAVWSLALGTAEDRCRRRRRDYYINNRFNLPENLKPGRYRLRSSQTDLVSGRTTSREVSLEITP